MEKELLHWLASTALFQMHRDSLELIPQFPIGEYLRQLDPTYVHPAWRVDFLLRVPTTDGRTVQIVIEYDGFEHHFRNRESVHVGNYSRYMTAADIERQTILESYGYKFLRVNRFNIGADPVQSLSDRLERLVRLSSVHEWG
jgi:very-short-patch-repair endonuclease